MRVSTPWRDVIKALAIKTNGMNILLRAVCIDYFWLWTDLDLSISGSGHSVDILKIPASVYQLLQLNFSGIVEDIKISSTVA